MRYILVLTASCLLVASSCTAKQADANTRERMISNFGLILKSWDKDRDGKLRRTEVQTMVDASFREIAPQPQDWQEHAELGPQRQQILDHYASEDTNRDGYLNLDELLKAPLATFDCMDANHDAALSKDEIFGSPSRCRSLNPKDNDPGQ